MCPFTVHKEKKEKSKENYYATRKNKIKIVMIQESHDIRDDYQCQQFEI